MVNLGNVDNTTDASETISALTQTALDTKAPLASPIFTGTVGGISKAIVNLANVDNTSDATKIISTLTQTALDLKCPRDNPSFTRIVSIASNVMFDAAPQDITFSNSSAAPYTLQFAFDSKQDTLTATTPAGGTQLLFGSTLKALKPGTNI